MYGGDRDCLLDERIIHHGELCEADVWDFVRHASIGLALATGPLPFDNDVSKILNYLRGGLPVLSEEPIVNNALVRETGFGKIFPYGDVERLVQTALSLLEHPPNDKKEAVMRYMAAEHSWDRRVETYLDLFERVLSHSPRKDESDREEKDN
jgi:glycosyltransferase involved in cell wall biosynthesis